MKILIITFIFFLGNKISLAQKPQNIGNLNANSELSEYNSELVFFNNKIFFKKKSSASLNPNTGFPYVCDGTLAGTFTLSNFAIQGSYPEFIKGSSNAYFFDGEGLKKTDGTLANTVLVKENILPGTSSNSKCIVGNTLFFKENDGSLWKSNGTNAGTVLVKTFNTSDNIRYFVSSNGLLFFNVNDATFGNELWKSDGTAAGTLIVKDIVPGIGDSFPSELIDLNGVLHFNLGAPPFNVSSLWLSDGTNAGTVPVTNNQLGYIFNPSNFTKFNSKLFLTNSGNYLNYTDGTSTGLSNFPIYAPVGNSNVLQKIYDIKAADPDLYVYTGNYNDTKPDKLIKLNTVNNTSTFLKNLSFPTTSVFSSLNKVQHAYLNGITYFTAADSQTGFELWRTDGTAAGTFLVLDINEGPVGSNPTGFQVLNNKIYFFAKTLTNGYELWSSDGTTIGTSQFQDLESNFFNSDPSSFLEYNSTIFFSANNAISSNQRQLASIKNLSTFPTVNFINTGGTPSNPIYITGFNNEVFYNASQVLSGPELFKYNPIGNTTTQVKDFLAGTNMGGNPEHLKVSNNSLFFAATNALNGRELWKTDGTNVGTVLVKDINPTTAVTSPSGTITTIHNSSPFALTDHNGILYFGATTLADGTELWQSDGTLANTVLVNNINPTGNGLSITSEIVSTPNTLYFVANNGSLGTELFKIDVSNPNGIQIKDISLGISSSSPAYLTPNGNSIYFSAITQGFDGRELWKSDGTSAGTVIVKNIAGNASGNPLNLKMVNGILFYTADDGVNGRELWRSDGTAIGTYMVKNINQSASSDPSELTAMGNLLYFTADDGQNGRELWRSDGTAESTVIVYNLFEEFYSNPLSPKKSSNPSHLFSFNNILYFGANDGNLGNEIFRVKPCTNNTLSFDKSTFLPSQLIGNLQTIVAENKFHSGTTVNFIAGNNILLKPGFEANSSKTIFNAEIKTCN